MRRRCVVAAVLAVAIAVAGCGSDATKTTSVLASGTAGASTTAGRSGSPSATATTSTASAGTVSVTPARIPPSATITIAAPEAQPAGRVGSSEISYSAQVTGPTQSGCVGQFEGMLTAGARGHLRLGPTELRGHWCSGRYAVRVTELSRPFCATGTVCPQFVRVVAVVGTARFLVS